MRRHWMLTIALLALAAGHRDRRGRAQALPKLPDAADDREVAPTAPAR